MKQQPYQRREMACGDPGHADFSGNRSLKTSTWEAATDYSPSHGSSILVLTAWNGELREINALRGV